MLKGVHLSLLIGPGVPVPAPKAVIEAVQSVQVTSGRDKSGFQITLAVSKKSSLLDTLLPAGFFDPITTRVIIVVTLGGFPHVLMDGVVTQHELSPSNEPGQSTLTITGEDLSVLMDVVELKVPFPQMSDTMQAYAMLAPYAAFGVVPIVIPSFILDIRVITEGYDSQTGTHLERLKYLADANGFVAWLTDLRASIGIPKTLREAGVREEHLPRLVEIAVADACHPNNPRPVTEADFKALFTKALG